MNENTTTPTAPSEWPGAFGIFKTSRDAVRYNLGTLVVLTLLVIGVSILLSVLLEAIFGKRFADSIGQLISYVVSIYFAVALTYAYLCTVRRKKVDVAASFKAVPPLFWRMFLLNLLTSLVTIGGFILFIVPGIIFAMRLSVAPYYLIDKDMGVMEAYKASWHATKGHLGKLWGMFGVCLLMLLPTVTIIGVVATIYLFFMYAAAAALFYLYLLNKPTHE